MLLARFALKAVAARVARATIGPPAACAARRFRIPGHRLYVEVFVHAAVDMSAEH
jgi:hypothetical protein